MGSAPKIPFLWLETLSKLQKKILQLSLWIFSIFNNSSIDEGACPRILYNYNPHGPAKFFFCHEWLKFCLYRPGCGREDTKPKVSHHEYRMQIQFFLFLHRKIRFYDFVKYKLLIYCIILYYIYDVIVSHISSNKRLWYGNCTVYFLQPLIHLKGESLQLGIYYHGTVPVKFSGILRKLTDTIHDSFFSVTIKRTEAWDSHTVFSWINTFNSGNVGFGG